MTNRRGLRTNSGCIEQYVACGTGPIAKKQTKVVRPTTNTFYIYNLPMSLLNFFHSDIYENYTKSIDTLIFKERFVWDWFWFWFSKYKFPLAPFHSLNGPVSSWLSKAS